MRGLGSSTTTWRAASLGGLLTLALTAAGCPADEGPSGPIVPIGGKDGETTEDVADAGGQPDTAVEDQGGGTPDTVEDTGGEDGAVDTGGTEDGAADTGGGPDGGEDATVDPDGEAPECTTAADCEGKVGPLTACDAATCLDGSCVKQTTPAPQCCLDAAGCDDGNACTTDSCPTQGGVCSYVSDPECCEDETTFLAASFEGGGAQGFTVVDTDGVAAVTWSVTSARAWDGQSSFYFGNAACPSYYGGKVDGSCLPMDPLQNDNELVAGSLLSPEIALPAGGVYYATWRLWSETEGIGDPSKPKCTVGGPVDCYDVDVESFVDALTVYVRDGATKTAVWNSAELNTKFADPGGVNEYDYFLKTTNGDFLLLAADLSPWAGKTVQLEFSFQGTELFVQSFFPAGKLPEGLYIDDVMIKSGCGSKLCGKDSDCNSTTPCTLDECTMFANAKDGVCLAPKDPECTLCPGGTAAECDDGDECTTDTCKAGECTYAVVAGCCEAAEFIKQGFEASVLPAGWTATGTSAATWHTTKKNPKTGAWSLWFGNEASGTYQDAAATPKGSVTSKAFTIPADAVKAFASFQLYLSTEWDAGEVPDHDGPVWYDILYIQVVDAATGVPIPLDEAPGGYAWDSYAIGGTTAGEGAAEYAPVVVDLDPWAGKTVRLRFTFDAGDTSTNAYAGAHIDDLLVKTSCDTQVCVTDADCGEAPNACTELVCAGGQCAETLTSPDCCVADAECDDGNPCTTDTCEASACVSVDSGNPACCFAQDATLEDFEGDPATWTFVGAGDVGWSFLSDEELAHGGAGALYFGNPSTMTYADGGNAVQGIAVSPTVTIPSGGVPVLSFWLKLSTEFDPTAENPNPWFDLFPLDRLTVTAVADGGDAVVVWDSSAVKGTTVMEPDGDAMWLKVEASLDALKGQTVSFHFEFDSLDGSGNDHMGALIDDLALNVTCGAAPDCFNDGDCADDGDVCTVEACVAGKCTTTPSEAPECCEPFDKWAESFDNGVQGSLGSFVVDAYTCANGNGGAECTASASAPVKWHVSAAQNHSAPFSLRFGSNATGTYDDAGKRVMGTATSGQVTLAADAGATLELWVWVDVEPWAEAVPNLDRTEVAVVDENGLETVVWDKSQLGEEGSGLYGQWQPVAVPLDAFAGQKVSVRVTFDSYDGFGNSGAGVFVDDVKIIQLCAP